MVQQFKVPETESELRQLQDKLYSITKEQTETGAFRGFRGLLEIMASETVIMTAIHNIKANKGAETAGTDGRTMRADILQQDYTQIVTKVQRSFQNYRPMSVRRKWIPKPGKSEKRPLGIPAIMDRIIQECVRIVLEPIMEAQFFKHSYGFRPWRDAHMALERVKDQVSRVGYYWIVEGDISKFFDNVNHTILIKKLWHMGVRDQRVLMIIKAMLKAGIMGEISENPLGTPQGGIIGVTSPAFCKYQKTYCKKPEETPYTVEGRAIHWERTRKKMTLPRMEEILTSSTLGMLIAYGKTKPIYNLEYFLNRMYALNRDKMRCRICGKPIVDGDDYHAHHIRKNLPLSEINRVSNLASTHRSCHKLVHGQKSKDGFSPKAVRQAEKYRKKLLS